MSKAVILYSGLHISSEEVFDLVKKLGGVIDDTSGSYTQGIIQKEESAIWIDYTNKKLNLDDEELLVLKEKFKIEPKIAVTVSISREEGSTEMAFEFCNEFMKRYKETAVDDLFGDFYLCDHLHMALRH